MPESDWFRKIQPGLVIAVFVVAAAWLAALAVLSRLHTAARQPGRTAVLPVYPDALDAHLASSPDWGWKTATYTVALNYPAMDVFDYYDEHMTRQQ